MKIVNKTLSSGLRVVLVPQKDAVTATMLTLVGVGSNKETKRQNGLSHFLEHVCFKGTLKRPSAKQINEEFEQIGAITNAFTSDEYTGYYAKGHPRHIEKLVEMVGDVVINATIPDVEVAKEKGVIIEELNMYEDMPQAKVMETLSALLYGDTPAGRSIGGTKETVRSFTRADIVRYKSTHYTTENTVVAVVGAFDEKTVMSAIKKTFAAFPKGEKGAYPKVSASTRTETVSAIAKPIDQTHIAIGFPTVPLGHKDGPALSLLATILGGGMSSQLFHMLREELGVAYYVRAEQDPHSTHGEFTITAGIDTKRVAEVLIAIIRVLKERKTALVPATELSKAREYNIGMLGMGLEATDMVAGFYASQLLLTGKIRTPEMVAKEYMKVTPEDIARVAKGIFTAKRARLSIVGPTIATDEFEALLKDL
ncbi:MAG TPA: pitrilysin family protein [Candidatus Paceibacterota bacterium]